MADAFPGRLLTVWEARSADGRAELERQFEHATGAAFSELGWKARHDALLASMDARLAREIGDARTALARVSKLHRDSHGRKTIRAADLKLALSKCDRGCGRWATGYDGSSPACAECMAERAALEGGR